MDSSSPGMDQAGFGAADSATHIDQSLATTGRYVVLLSDDLDHDETACGG